MKITQYQKISSLIRSGDVILWKGTGLIAWTIRKFSGDFSHASLVLRLDEFQGLTDRRWVLEATRIGVFPNLLSNAIKLHGKPFLYPLKNEFSDKRDILVSWGLSHVGTGYDFWGVFRNIFGYVSANLRRMWCSEFVQLDYENAKIREKENKGSRPGDIAQWICFKEPVQIEE